MPRQGVPYPERLMCSLKCELKSIWNALNGKLHSVNGVEGDGAGNVNIVSGDAAVTVTPDASLNQIEVSLDRSQLPSAAVTSVNGETGAVVLDASEIDSGVVSPGNSVEDDIGSMYTQVRGINSGLTAETTARANADAALQTNISASNLRISNIESAISTDPDPDTIGLRDANGRLKAADPANGATDKTLVTANWVSQTGEARPNNLIHATGSDRFRSYFQQTGFSNTATSSQGVNLQVIRPSDDLSATIGNIAVTRNIAAGDETTRQFMFSIYKDNQNWIRLSLEWVNSNNTGRLVLYKAVNGVTSATTVATL